MGIAYVDGPRLRRSLLAASEHARSHRAELNRINVFPVPDGDTGTNLALTVRAVTDRLRDLRDRDVSTVAREAARAAVLGARGNCGMMLSHFLLGFADRLRGRSRVAADELAEAFGAGAERLQQALDRPVEGTILTVIRDTARAAREAGSSDVEILIRKLVDGARASLARTPELLPALRKAGVVDAGAKGFVHLLEGVLLYIRGETPVEGTAAAASGDEEEAAPAARADVPAGAGGFRYCTEALVRGPDLPGQEEMRARLRERGDSLLVIRTEDAMKVHLHTDEPEIVFSELRTLGRLVTHKAEDLEVQHRAVERAAARPGRLARRPVGVVTDSASDLPDEVLRAHGIRVVPLELVAGEHTYRDREDISAEEFAELIAREGELPTTSQPPPGAFVERFRDAGADAEEVVAVVLSSGLSGTFAAAESAAGLIEEPRVHVVDSRGASLLQGLLALKAAELGEAGRGAGDIVRELRRIRRRSGLLFTLDRLDRLRASGRIGWGAAWLGSMLAAKPILALDEDGEIVREGRAFGRKRVLPAVLDRLERKIPDGAGSVRFGIVHVGREEVVDEVAAALRDRWGEVEILSGAVTPVIATHTGLGAWGVAYLVED